MLDLNYFVIFWFVLVSAFILVEIMAKFNRFILSKWIQEFFIYGKAKKLHDQESKINVKPAFIDFLVNSLRMPKRYFIHFYIFAFILQSIILVLYLQVNHEQFERLLHLNRFIFGSKSLNYLASKSQLQTVLAYIFLHFQVIRRLYENYKVSIFSDTTIHLVHYLIGYLFYLSVSLLQFNLLFRTESQSPEPIAYANLIIGSLIYVCGYAVEHISLIQLASLRSKTGSSNRHFIPKGLLFEFVSCPHYFGEILIYLGITVLLDGYMNLSIISIWTILLHINMAFQSHNWYLKKFGQNYPKNRRALIPFIM